jgi:hypothetical protein
MIFRECFYGIFRYDHSSHVVARVPRILKLLGNLSNYRVKIASLYGEFKVPLLQFLNIKYIFIKARESVDFCREKIRTPVQSLFETDILRYPVIQ